MYTILPLALALTAVAVPLGPNGGAGNPTSPHGPESLSVAGGLHALQGSRTHQSGIAGDANEFPAWHANAGGIPGGASNPAGPHGPESFPAAGAAHALQGSRTHQSGIAGNADKLPAWHANAEGIPDGAKDPQASRFHQRGFAIAGGEDEFDAQDVVKRRGINLTSSPAGGADEETQ